MLDKIPTKICDQVPALKDYGLYRKLNNGNEEFVSYCQKEAADYTAINKARLKKLLDDNLPKAAR